VRNHIAKRLLPFKQLLDPWIFRAWPLLPGLDAYRAPIGRGWLANAPEPWKCREGSKKALDRV
jgi:hypothetical protein